MGLFYRIRGQLISKYPETDGIGGWKIIMHYDCDPSNGGPPYVNIWEHTDGRQSQEGPGFCDDPDLELLLFQQQRETIIRQMDIVRNNSITKKRLGRVI